MGLADPIDTLGDIRFSEYRSTMADAINPLKRKRISEPLSLGIKSIDGFMTVGKGQRMGVFAGFRRREKYYNRYDGKEYFC